MHKFVFGLVQNWLIFNGLWPIYTLISIWFYSSRYFISFNNLKSATNLTGSSTTLHLTYRLPNIVVFCSDWYIWLIIFLCFTLTCLYWIYTIIFPSWAHPAKSNWRLHWQKLRFLLFFLKNILVWDNTIIFNNFINN